MLKNNKKTAHLETEKKDAKSFDWKSFDFEKFSKDTDRAREILEKSGSDKTKNDR